jgi:hypothetical protein
MFVVGALALTTNSKVSDIQVRIEAVVRQDSYSFLVWHSALVKTSPYRTAYNGATN